MKYTNKYIFVSTKINFRINLWYRYILFRPARGMKLTHNIALSSYLINITHTSFNAKDLYYVQIS